MNKSEKDDLLRASYDTVAAEYAKRLFNELEHKPFDRALLKFFAEQTSAGKVCDMGCGPGQIAAFLHAQGANVFGCDLSPEMVAVARAQNPGIKFRVEDMRALRLPHSSLRGVAAFYTLIHIPREQMVDVLTGIKQTLSPGGLLLASFHLEDENWRDKRLTEWWGYEVAADFYFFRRDEIEHFFNVAGFDIQLFAVRAPYPDVEAQTQRAYVMASKK